jgi:hypothetical protein
MNMDQYRAQLMQAASIHGGMQQQQMLTQKSIEITEKEIANNSRLNKVIEDAIKDNTIKADDSFFKFLKVLLMQQGNTLEGKERALRMAIYITHKTNKEFKVEKR